MQNKFKNKYRIPSTRLQTWDYSSNGAYFITICTKNREHFFGNIQNGIMQLSEIGILAKQYWMEIPNHFPFIELGNFVVMPNHVHGILIINKIDDLLLSKSVETRFIASNNCHENNENNETRLIASNINENNENNGNNENNETRLIASLQENRGGFSGEKNPMLNGNISKIIRWYKGRCSFECRKINSNFGWQSLFYDHIIRNSKSFDIIQNYIFENPLKWKNDKFYK
ncbi:transposase [Flavobacterium sp.]|uniref:transposase n=1 Tax=Flavobacterium sp. TaxID=239 RepID=UPI00260B11D8|nr:transposase [Flavobacterium sp.]